MNFCEEMKVEEPEPFDQKNENNEPLECDTEDTEHERGACGRCCCPGYYGGGSCCSRSGCGHHYDEHW